MTVTPDDREVHTTVPGPASRPAGGRSVAVPKVTVIIPNYNHARYLDRRIRSVLDQTYQDFEVIYLDDASTDDSNAVFRQYADDPRFTAVYNQINSGSTFKQWNRGMRRARGEYVWFAESDDYADERLLEELVIRLDRDPRVGLAYCQSWEVDEHDRNMGSMEQWIAEAGETRWQRDFINDGREECRRSFLFKNTIPNASGVLFRRAVYEQVGGTDETMRLCGDWLLWIKILLVADIAFVARPLNYFRTHARTARSSTVRGGVRVEESYRVLAFLACNLPLPREALDRACDLAARDWLFAIRAARIPWRRNRAIYRVARGVDPRFHHRLLMLVGQYLFKGAKRRLAALLSRA
jgi:glycosyltransferase involved in cell wall biosynthesis